MSAFDVTKQALEEPSWRRLAAAPRCWAVLGIPCGSAADATERHREALRCWAAECQAIGPVGIAFEQQGVVELAQHFAGLRKDMKR